MSLTVLVLVLLAVTLVVNLLVAAVIIWVSARCCRVATATFKQAILAAMIVALAPLLLLAFRMVVGMGEAGNPRALLEMGAVSLLALYVGIKLAHGVTPGRAALVALLALVLTTAYSELFLRFIFRPHVMEAYVNPTGGMAETLWGYHKTVACPNCGFTFPLNASSEADPQAERHQRITHCECPNCHADVDFAPDKLNPAPQGGDRFVVAKLGYGQLQRHQIVTFDFPVNARFSYVKRLIGLPGETIAICQGQVYAYSKPRDLPEPEAYWADPLTGSLKLWPDDPGAKELWDQGKFEIVRKPPDLILAMRRIVFDNDYQPANQTLYPTRWTADGGWKGEEPLPRSFALADSVATLQWLRYRHVLHGGAKPELITDFLGYNSGDSYSGNGVNWVGDLILDCDVQIDKVEPGGELRLELARGVDLFQARFNLQTGDCSLFRVAYDGTETPLLGARQLPATAPTALKQPGKYHVRLANVDERLTLWTNDDLPFGDGVGYVAASRPGPTCHDLKPASIGLQGAVGGVAHLQLWRDTYYTQGVTGEGDETLAPDARDDPTKWEKLRTLAPRYFYVQPGHYLCLGDNSPASSDGRSWGMVPDRLMRGPAVLIYYPLARAGRVR